MDIIITIASMAIYLILFFMIYGKLSAISKKLDAQNSYYQKLAEDRQLEIENQKFQKAFGGKKPS